MTPLAAVATTTTELVCVARMHATGSATACPVPLRKTVERSPSLTPPLFATHGLCCIMIHVTAQLEHPVPPAASDGSARRLEVLQSCHAHLL